MVRRTESEPWRAASAACSDCPNPATYELTLPGCSPDRSSSSRISGSWEWFDDAPRYRSVSTTRRILDSSCPSQDRQQDERADHLTRDVRDFSGPACAVLVPVSLRTNVLDRRSLDRVSADPVS